MLFVAITIGITIAIDVIVPMIKLSSGNYRDFAIEVTVALLLGQTILKKLVVVVILLFLVWMGSDVI